MSSDIVHRHSRRRFAIVSNYATTPNEKKKKNPQQNKQRNCRLRD